jgi:hypothetical protein
MQGLNAGQILFVIGGESNPGLPPEPSLDPILVGVVAVAVPIIHVFFLPFL